MKSKMKRLIGFILLSAIIFVFLFSEDSMALINKRDDHSIHVYLIGDSTVSTYKPNLAPRMGWGQEISVFFNDHVIVHNAAVPGRSSKSFYDEGRFKKIKKKLQYGDYLFIQFGHNDAKKNDLERYTDPNTTFKAYLKKYIDGAREKGAIPILVTPVERRSFSNDGMIKDTHGNYPEAMKQLAIEEDVDVIDLTDKSKQLFDTLGPEKTKQLFLWLKPNENNHYPDGKSDNTHLQERGAYMVASLVIEGIIESNLKLKEFIIQH